MPLAAAIALGVSAGAGAATVAVNDASGDSTTGACTLADAVQAINTALAVNGCAAGDGVSDTVDLSFFTTPTTITFQNPNAPDVQAGIEVTKPMAIVGPVGADGKPLVTIARSASSNAYFRVIGAGADLTLSNVNVQGGRVSNARGAGVNATGHANLTITNSTVSGNTIAGNSLYSGGGIASEYGNITLTGSTVSGNSATSNGGGIYTQHEGAIVLTNSTVSGNHADYYGAGIYNFNGDVTLTGSTVANNRAIKSYFFNGQYQPRGGFGAAGIWVYHKLTMTSSTVTGNYSRMGAAAVIVAGPYYAARPNRPQRLGTQAAPRSRPAASPFQKSNAYLSFTTISRNSNDPNFQTNAAVFVDAYLSSVASIITQNPSGNLQFGTGSNNFAGSKNIIGSPPFTAPPDTVDCDPKLGPLANWGGPTATLPLLAGSCAIDAGPGVLPAGITTDQRGLPRRVGTAIDIGAFEKQGDTDPDLIFDGGFETSG